MAAPAGPCEWCGGQQSWTVIRGEMYVRCRGGCQSLFPEERVSPSPPDSEVYYLSSSENGTLGGEGVVPRKGGEARTSGEETEGLPF